MPKNGPEDYMDYEEDIPEEVEWYPIEGYPWEEDRDSCF